MLCGVIHVILFNIHNDAEFHASECKDWTRRYVQNLRDKTRWINIDLCFWEFNPNTHLNTHDSTTEKNDITFSFETYKWYTKTSALKYVSVYLSVLPVYDR